MVAFSGSGDSKQATNAYKDKSKPAEIRKSNISAAKGLSETYDTYFYSRIPIYVFLKKLIRLLYTRFQPLLLPFQSSAVIKKNKKKLLFSTCL